MDQLQPNEALSLEQLIIAHRHILRYYDEKIAKGLIPSDTDRLRRERESWRKELLEWLGEGGEKGVFYSFLIRHEINIVYLSMAFYWICY